MIARKKLKLILAGLFLFLFLSLFTPQTIYAKKKIGAKTVTSVGAVSTSWKMVISPRLRADRKALQVTFSNLSGITMFTYELTYEGNGVDQGVYGSVKPQGESSLPRELLFGTCSGSVCRYHTGIKKMKFSVTTTYKNGRKIIKRYTVRP